MHAFFHFSNVFFCFKLIGLCHFFFPDSRMDSPSAGHRARERLIADRTNKVRSFLHFPCGYSPFSSCLIKKSFSYPRTSSRATAIGSLRCSSRCVAWCKPTSTLATPFRFEILQFLPFSCGFFSSILHNVMSLQMRRGMVQEYLDFVAAPDFGQIAERFVFLLRLK